MNKPRHSVLAIYFLATLNLCGCLLTSSRQESQHDQTSVPTYFTSSASESKHNRVFQISSDEQLKDVCERARPGDTLIVKNGTYTDQQFIFTSQGARDNPITLRSETPGRVIFNGSSTLSISGSFLVVDGFLFREGALTSGSVISFASPDMTPATHCVLKNTAIIDYNPPNIDTRYFWVSLYGDHNRVEHCLFSGQAHSGVTVCVWLQNGRSARHVIRRNHFIDRPVGNGNGFESIRIGTSKTSMTNAQCIVAENLFEQCNGEIEIISNKSCENTYRHNTFLRCSGCLTLRHGNRCEVSSNIFLGESVKGTGGVRVIGEGHRILKNYFSGIMGRAGGCISIYAGIPNSPTTGYPQVKDCIIDSNTFVRNGGSIISLGTGYATRGRTLIPERVSITNNLMLASEIADQVIRFENNLISPFWSGNVLIGAGSQIPSIPGVERRSDAPNTMKRRLNPIPLKPSDVGPKWFSHYNKPPFVRDDE